MYLWTMHGYLHIIDIINGHFYSFKNKRVSFSNLWTAWKLEKFIVNICEDGHGFQTMVIVQVSHRYLLKLQVKEVFIQFITKCIKKKKKKKISMKYQCVHFSQQNIQRKHLKGHPIVQHFLLVSNWTKSDPQN